MTDKNLELPLTTDWLNDRERFDLKARNPSILNSFLSTVAVNGPLVIADVGSGTGNNASFLSGLIKGNCTWYLIERELALHENAKRKIAEQYPGLIKEDGNTFHITTGKKQMTFHFCNETLETFLNRNLELSAVTCSALFDLFTKEEFVSLFIKLAKEKIPLYSVLNYCGASIVPVTQLGVDYISKFESHMSRQLAKGRPMGIDTMKVIHEIVSNSTPSHIDSGESNWEIPKSEKRFLLQNFNFYKAAVLDLLATQEEKNDFSKWLEIQELQIEKGSLELQVKHQDFLIRHS